jgi:transcriptional regulator with XRE-family HTH domain
VSAKWYEVGMWSPDQISSLRERLGMEVVEFAKLLGVDARTVRRWESGDARPTGSAEAVMNGISAGLDRDPATAEKIISMLAGAAAVGGLAYLIVKLLELIEKRER